MTHTWNTFPCEAWCLTIHQTTTFYDEIWPISYLMHYTVEMATVTSKNTFIVFIFHMVSVGFSVTGKELHWFVYILMCVYHKNLAIMAPTRTDPVVWSNTAPISNVYFCFIVLMFHDLHFQHDLGAERVHNFFSLQQIMSSFSWHVTIAWKALWVFVPESFWSCLSHKKST